VLQKGISPSPSQRPRLTSRLVLKHSFKQTNRFSSGMTIDQLPKCLLK
ncbi:unnamed protein product, partial [Brassica oleracea var. botrytis]